MRYFTILVIGSLIVFSPLYVWASQQHQGQKQQYQAADPVKFPHAFQGKDGFPTGSGCSVPKGFFKSIDKLKQSNPCAPDMYNPCDPCSVRAAPNEAAKVGE